ncbi:hypothetical protein F2P56_018911 [Juglans regia]|uniref:Reverse transcriptase domain-containing protein n=2 Tax=Juglans regia TaxID=51240 RepID=A0A833UJM4_JUGRE|nr:uncharacterized mitochondrial protein AtMg01250-like [Juglans regia]KAF5462949.1 hypothetical protein F2P56_018911 [Juglans regia]
MEKEYDHVNWDFLLDLLRRCGFGERLRSWIRWCISTTKFIVQINGSPTGFFNNTQGLRQGDPLSPLLFVIVMEALSKMTSALVANGRVTGYSIRSPSGRLINISYLLFLDDTLIFCEVDNNQIQVLKALILCFEAVSGLRVNLDKSDILPIGGVPRLRQLANTLGCKIALLPMTYIRLPLGATSSGYFMGYND